MKFMFADFFPRDAVVARYYILQYDKLASPTVVNLSQLAFTTRWRKAAETCLQLLS